jgi:signal transduction histidine kinase
MKTSKLRPVILLGLLLGIPLAFLTWAGFRAVAEEERTIKQAFEELLEGRLRELDSRLQGVAAKYAQIVQRGVRLADSPAELRQMTAKTPMVRQFFVQDAAGKVVFPVLSEPLTESEQLFLQRTGRIFDEKRLLSASPEPSTSTDTSTDTSANTSTSTDTSTDTSANTSTNTSTDTSANTSKSTNTGANTPTSAGSGARANAGASVYEKWRSDESYRRPDSGWFAWYWENGMQILFWQKLPDGRLFGAEFSPNALLADLIAELPEQFQGDALLGSATLILRDGLQRNVHRIGGRAPGTAEKPVAKIPLAAPLNTWVLEFYPALTGSQAALGQTSRRPFLLSLMAVGVTLILLAVVLWREHARELREAEQRVSFVNQVSHELKTPLTNIRLYAELLEKDLDPQEQPGAWRKLDIIVQESRRLSRLIANVLTFSKQSRGLVTVKPRPESPDEVIKAVVAGFLPALESRHLRLEMHLETAERVAIDPDLLGQVLGNLLSNVEKYAAPGGRVVINSSARPRQISVRVRDFGPGIPAGRENDIFGPFCRLTDHLTEGVSGTGIGLHLSRELARAHGGDLRLVWNNGPVFPGTPAAENESSQGLGLEMILCCEFAGPSGEPSPAKEGGA